MFVDVDAELLLPHGTSKMTDTKLPPNIQEFNEITAVIFRLLYTTFPSSRIIKEEEIAKALGLARCGLFFQTRMWLIREGFVRSEDDILLNPLGLTAKAMAVLGQSLGPQLVDAAIDTSTEDGKSKLAELVGTFLGSFTGSATKAISGGG
jgi:hypothetical protein